MKLLLVKFVFCFAVALAAPADKQKRDILPGDPRYGTEHHHHHHHEHENEVQISKAAGGYVGSYTVPDDTVPEAHSFQVQSEATYGPPSHTPGKPLGSDLFASIDTIKSPASVHVPSTSYGIPDTTQILNNNYLGPVIDENNKKPIDIKTTVLDLNTDSQAPSIQAPITSYDVKQLVNVPQTSYGTPVVKTAIHEPQFDTVHVQKTVIPEVHHEVHHAQDPLVVHKHVETIPQSVSLPQVKVAASHVPTETQGVVQHSVPSSFSTFPNYNSYSSYSNIPLKTVDHHVHVQVPQPYHVPVTKHVAVPVPVPHTVEIPKPYYVRVPQPVQVTVDRPYPVEVPRPVPYPVPHYVKTSVPVAHSHHLIPTTVDTKANPFQSFFDNTQTTFQNVVSGLPTFGNPLEGFQNPFENFDLSSFPPLSFIPSSLPSFIPQPQQPQSIATTEHVSVPASTNSDTVTIDNLALKPETTIIKTNVVQPTHHTHPTKTVPQTQQVYKPPTACAGCIVSSPSSKQEYVQPTDANGGYVY